MKATMSIIYRAIAVIAFACFGLLPQVEAVSPAPDGGYPGGNTAEGQTALLNLTSGGFNTAVGYLSLGRNTSGSFNTATGAGTLLANTTADGNTATGAGALLSNTIGIQNTADGAFALFSHPNGAFNTAIGYAALKNSIAGADNTAVGCFALENNNGGDNTVVGYGALGTSTGFNNTVIGSGAGNSISSASNVICIGASVAGANVDHSCFIGEIYSNVQPVVGTDPDVVTINSSGRLGRANVSSRRYKHDIKPMDKASEVLYSLKPVSFRYNKEYDATQTIAFGLISEEVAEVNADLVGRNPHGEPESVRYEQINAMLLNEFLKEHCKVDEQQATITELKSTVAQQQKDFQARFAEQEGQIKSLASDLQRVSARVEATRSAPRLVANEP